LLIVRDALQVSAEQYNLKLEELSLRRGKTIKALILIRAATIVTVILLMACSGCTGRTAYDSLRYNRELDCQKMQGTADREECLKKSGMSYDEYQRQLNKQQSSDDIETKMRNH
jgi:hypothetical protein